MNKENMALEEEMKLWESRQNDNLGKLIQYAYEETKDIIYSYVDSFGIEHNPIKSILTIYSLDGNKKYSLRELKNVLENYDICNFEDRNLSNNVELTKKVINFERKLKVA